MLQLDELLRRLVRFGKRVIRGVARLLWKHKAQAVVVTLLAIVPLRTADGLILSVLRLGGTAVGEERVVPLDHLAGAREAKLEASCRPREASSTSQEKPGRRYPKTVHQNSTLAFVYKNKLAGGGARDAALETMEKSFITI